jgi:hypothetical protein
VLGFHLQDTIFNYVKAIESFKQNIFCKMVCTVIYEWQRTAKERQIAACEAFLYTVKCYDI